LHSLWELQPDGDAGEVQIIRSQREYWVPPLKCFCEYWVTVRIFECANGL
jgi:hypothetical protein